MPSNDSGPARRVLVGDDDAAIRQLLKTFLEGEGFDVLEASSGSQILEKATAGKQPPELILMDLRMPDGNGMEVLQKIKADHSDVGAIIMTAYGTANTAIQAIQMGAFDYVTKPFELDDVLLTIRRYFEYRDLTAEVSALRSELTISEDPMEKIVGNSTKMQDIYKTIGRVARSDATVLIWGETGTGKELVANAMHYNSARRNGPFIKVNCAALPETLLESELFGHEKGAFTGALIQRKGRFELANHGSIFLDEIGEMTMNTQRKLLRVLQEREFERVGSSTPIKVDVRIIAATNRDLAKDVQEGRFREDLFYRLNVIAVQMPPLREKKEDIPELVAFFCNKHRLTKDAEPAQVSEEAMQKLLEHDWPGNVRELENVIERAIVTAQGGVIAPEHLVFAPAGEKRIVDVVQRVNDRVPFRQIVAEVERHALLQALDLEHDDHRKAADMLDLPIKEFEERLVELGIKR
ncbi:MAG TPA: sigma-54 dependent transcriptional regulator [Chloroflexota bacterium]|nr:sigma-54 dependent transcriptional regulator [Chloroflexota bacterium]